jgi:uncharacterized membrane protein
MLSRFGFFRTVVTSLVTLVLGVVIGFDFGTTPAVHSQHYR